PIDVLPKCPWRAIINAAAGFDGIDGPVSGTRTEFEHAYDPETGRPFTYIPWSMQVSRVIENHPDQPGAQGVDYITVKTSVPDFVYMDVAEPLMVPKARLQFSQSAATRTYRLPSGYLSSSPSWSVDALHTKPEILAGEVQSSQLVTEQRNGYGRVVQTTVIHGAGEYTQQMEVTDYLEDEANWLFAPLETATTTTTPEGSATTVEARTFVPGTLLVETETRAPDEPDYFDRTHYTYDERGRLTSLTWEPEPGVMLVQETREYEVSWSPKPTRLTDALGRVTRIVPEGRLGGVAATIDFFGTVRQTDVDYLGRPTRHRAPYNLLSIEALMVEEVSFEYVAAPAPGTLRTIIRPWDYGVGNPIYRDVDAHGRPVYTEWTKPMDLEDSNAAATQVTGERVYVEQFYDGQGRRHARSLTTYVGLDPAGYHTTAYDDLGRPQTVGAPDSSEEEFAYWGLNEAWRTDPRGGTTHTWADEVGNVAEVTNALGVVTRFAHGPYGPTEVTRGYGSAEPLVHTYSYRPYTGQRWSTTTPEEGTRGFTVDGYDRIDSYTDANNITETYVYDDFGRLVERIMPHGSDVLVWDTHRLGELSSGSSADGITTLFSYDPLGRITSMVVNAGEGLEARQTFDFSTIGLLEKVSYTPVLFQRDPPTVEVSVGHDPMHNMRTLNCTTPVTTGLPIWRSDTYSVEGRPLQTILGDDGLSQTRTLDPLTRRTSALVGSVVGGAVVQSWQYQHDAAGNVEWLSDSISGQELTLTYDILNRLETSTLNGPGNSNEMLEQLGYHPIHGGEITTRNQREYTVDPTTRHLLSSDGEEVHFYDARGTISQLSSIHGSFGFEFGTGPAAKIRLLEHLETDRQTEYRYDVFDHLVVQTDTDAGELTTTLFTVGDYREVLEGPLDAPTHQRFEYQILGPDGSGASIELTAEWFEQWVG
ncbi:MAG: hypothetical protein AAFS10_12460, partial [Myxococcota bacterium]